MRMTKEVKKDIETLLEEGLDVFFERWEKTGSMEDEIRYNNLCRVSQFVYERLKLGGV